METFDFRGQPIAYVRAGKGDPVVFLHNGGTSHAIWREVMEPLSKTHEVFALDLLGYGASAKPKSGYTLGNYVTMIEEFLASHGLSPVALVGNCMGSAMSLAFTMKHPQDVRALVLINPLTEATFSAGWLGGTYWLRRNLPGVSKPFFKGAEKLRLPAWGGRQVLRFQLGAKGVSRKAQENPELSACYASPGQMRSLLAVVEDLESYGALDKFVPGEDFPPLCTIWGLENRVLSAEAGMKLNQNLAPRRQVWLEGCGHLPMMEQPEKVAAVLQEFLDFSEPKPKRREKSPQPVEALR